MVVVTGSGWPVGGQPALAHEFTVALVTPTSATANAELDGSDVTDGFRLAVDRSPDVSHAPGTAAGDHLGGVDVDVTVIDGTSATDAAAAVQQGTGSGLTVVVVVAADATARAVAQGLRGSSVLLVVARGGAAGGPADVGALQLAQRSAPGVDTAEAAEVAAAFRRAHGRPLSAAAALGYDAGRLIDVAVARADDGIEDLDSVIAAGIAVDDELVSSDVTAPEGPAAAGTADGSTTTAADGAGTEGLPVVVALAGGAVLLLLGVLAGARARRRWPSRR